ncbi:MAG: NIPSNAP family protein [Chloroflexi bacterium]|nr:NIPSNAP family protein [Chloroflexota bacterium]
MSIYVGTQIVPTPGSAQAVLAQGDRYNKLVEKIGGKVVAGFQIAIGQGQGTLAILSAWPDLATYQSATQRAQSDPEWQKFITEVGSLVAGLNSAVYTPAPTSPMQ